MTLRCTAVALLLVSSLAAQTSVWKVTRGGHTVYVGGTVHMLREADFPLPREFDAAFATSDTLYFETDIARMRSGAVQEIVAAEGMFTDGRTLERVLTPAAWKTVQTYCAKAGLPLEQMKLMKPWLFALTMALVELQKLGVSTEGVDLHFYNRAAESGKTTGALEPFDQHIRFLVNLGAGRESEMIEKSLDDITEMPRILDQIIASWRAGDLAKIDRLMLRDIRRKFPTIYKSLLADRNASWAPKIEGMLRTRETEFVLVGAAHLPGADGLLALLKARGCQVQQFIAPPEGNGKPSARKAPVTR